MVFYPLGELVKRKSGVLSLLQYKLQKSLYNSFTHVLLLITHF